jgi:calcineurin-like phosphoesterase family protein
MSEIFLTSDTHFSHIANFLWKPRGFTSVEEMNEAIIERWNNIVKPGDLVYHLGDIMLSDNKKGIECFNRLNGEIFVIWGNHDSDNRKNLLAENCPHFRGGWYAYLIKHEKLNIYLSHYPTLTANYDEKHFSQHVINVHGHTHQKTNWINPSNPFTYHVGMDSHNCTPIHIEEVISDIRQRWNEIEQLPTTSKPEDMYPYGGII